MSLSSLSSVRLSFCILLSGLNTIHIIGQPLSTVRLVQSENFRISSPSPLIKFSTFFLYRNLFRPFQNQFMKSVLTLSHLVAFVNLFTYHSAAGAPSKEEESAFFLKV